MPPGLRREVALSVDSVVAVLQPTVLISPLDIPFALLFLVALHLIHPSLALVAAVDIGLVCLVDLLNGRRAFRETRARYRVAGIGARLRSPATQAEDAVRTRSMHGPPWIIFLAMTAVIPCCRGFR